MVLYIKFMVSHRCKKLVQQQLDNLNIPYISVELGTVQLYHPLNPQQIEQLGANLLQAGLALVDNKKNTLVARIKSLVEEMVYHSTELPKHNYSTLISKQLKCNYTLLANLFSEVQGITLRQYIIQHKIERVKDFLLKDELNLTEIADQMHYSSVAHLSNQFKKVTGHTPTAFKMVNVKKHTKMQDV